MLSLPLSIYWGIKPSIDLNFRPHKYLNKSLKIAISLGFLWAPLAYVLAGNWTFTFKDKQEFQRQHGSYGVVLETQLHYSTITSTNPILLFYKPSISKKTIKFYLREMTTTPEHDARIAQMTFASVYPLYLNKIEKKGRTKAELDTVIQWLTGLTINN